MTDDGASWAPTWSPAGDGIAFLHLDGQTVDLRLAKLDGDAPNWTVSETIDLTEVSDLEPASAPGLVHPGRPAAGARRRRAPAASTASAPPPSAAAVTDDLPRAPRRAQRGDRHGPVPGPRPRSGRPARRASRRDLAGVERVRRRSSSRRPCPHAAAVKPNLAFFEAYGSAGHRRPRAAAGAHPGRRAGHRRRQARRHRDDRRPPGRGPVRRPRRRRRDRQPVPRRDGHRAAPRAARPLRLRPVPDVQPGRRRAAGPARRGGPGDRRAGGAASTRGSPGSRRAGDRAARSGSSSARRPPSELARDPRRRARVWPSSCPASAPRAAPSTRSSPTVRRPPHRPPDDPVAGCSSTCPGASPEPVGRRPRPGDLVRAPSRRPPPTGLNDSLCYPSRPGTPRLGAIRPCRHPDPSNSSSSSSSPC